MAETEEISRTADVLRRIGADDVHRAVKALSANRQQLLANALHTPVTALTVADSAADVVRRRARGLSRSKLSALARDLVEVCADETIVALGDRSDDPSYEDLVGVLDALIARWDVRIVALLLAATADGDFRARDVCERLLDDDPRFALESLGPVHDEKPVPSVTTRTAANEEELAAKREQRRQRREAKPVKTAAAPPARRSYRKKPKPTDTDTDTDNDMGTDMDTEIGGDLFDERAPKLTVGDRPLSDASAPLRRVRVIGNYTNARHDDPLVGAVVIAYIRFRPRPEAEPFGKTRPCVVVAACDGDRLVVRPCYSEGGLRSRKWTSQLITNPRAAGLEKAGYVSDEEYLIKRARIEGPIGWLAREDWNML